MQHRTAMWQVYALAGHEVTIIQQWHDPFGAPMLRFGLSDGAEIHAAGMTEAAFLARARLLRAAGAELVEGARA